MPVSIIITSYYSNIDFFRNLLIEFYKIIKLDFESLTNNNKCINYLLNDNNNNYVNKIRSFQKLEFLNYLNFCIELLRPPNKSILTLNMRFNSINYKFNSFQEMPNNDFCIEILFNSLEISTIIKLFTALLFEKHIIIVANQNLSLFCIGESLKLLLFPLSWPHIYIPNLPYEQINYLESPTPYLMGINSPIINIQNLIEQFPSNIICDVNTSTIYGNNLSNLKLPTKEEKRIKSQLLKLKSKYNNNYDEIDFGIINTSFNSSSRKTNSIETISNSNSNSDLIDENDYQLSFAQNVQNIFFALFKKYFANIKNEYISGNIFNSQKFLNSFKDAEYKFFFGKLINTLIFEDFILSMQYYDDSFSRQYNNIINKEEKKRSFIDKKDKYFSYEFNIKKNIKNNRFFKNAKLNFINDYNEISDIIEKNMQTNNDFNENNIKLAKRNSYSYKELKEKIEYSGVKKNNINHIKDKNSKKYIILNFYGNNNFISFYQKNNDVFMYHKLIYKEINQIYEEISSSYACNSDYKMVQINNSPSNNCNNEEKEEENENEKITEIPINYTAQLFIIIGMYLSYDIKYQSFISENSINNGSLKQIEKRLSNGKIKNEGNLNINKEISNKQNKNNISIIKLFINAFRKNHYEFPRNIFYMILDNFTLEELKKIEKTNIKYIDKTIQYKINDIEKNTYKPLVINTDSDIDGSIDDEQQTCQINYHKMSDYFDSIFDLNTISKNNDGSFSVKDEDEEKIKKGKINVISYLPNSSENNKENINKMNYNNANCYSKIIINNSNNHFDINKIHLFDDPMALSERICLQLYSFLCNVKIENYNIKNYDINFFKDLAYSEEFDEIKNLIISLKNISIENLRKNKINYYCFWLNIYNFLTIFSVIFKCEAISNYYEWYRFLKNSYFDIGNIVISLYEIESYILRGRETSKRIYTNIIDNTQFKIKQVERIDNNLINYGISLPNYSAPIIRIYYPFNFIDSLKINEIDFFSRYINYNIQKQKIEIPEYITWIDPNFKNHINNYESYLPKSIFTFLNRKMDIEIIKYDWKLTFANFKQLQNNK